MIPGGLRYERFWSDLLIRADWLEPDVPRLVADLDLLVSLMTEFSAPLPMTTEFLSPRTPTSALCWPPREISSG